MNRTPVIWLALKRLAALMPFVLVSVPTIVVGQSVTSCGNGDPNCVSLPGPVGIGTTSPAAGSKLELFDGFLQVTKPAGSTGTALIWFSQQNVPTNQGTWALGSRNAGHFVFYNAGSNRDVMNLLPNGNVGIGTQTPGQALELVRYSVDNALRFQNPGQYWYTIGINNSLGGLFSINRGPSPASVPDLTISYATGNVGIGTAFAPYKLTLAGSMDVGYGGTINVNSGVVVNSDREWVGSDVLSGGRVSTNGNLEVNNGTVIVNGGQVVDGNRQFVGWNVISSGVVRGTSMVSSGIVQGTSVVSSGIVQGTSVVSSGIVQGTSINVNGTTVIDGTGHWVGPAITPGHNAAVCDAPSSPSYHYCGGLCGDSSRVVAAVGPTTGSCDVTAEPGSSCSRTGCPACPYVLYVTCCVCRP